jgi:hypothetical protein
MDPFHKINDAIATVEEEITRLQDRLQKLRARRNSLTPIYRLPAEVLVHIFKLVQEPDMERMETEVGLSFDDPDLSDRGWIELTFACRLFRDVTLAERSL